MPAPRRAAAEASLIEHLNAQAPKKPVNEFLGIQKYFTSADMLLRQAASYRSSRNEEQLYVMLMRYASLVLETIPAHKDYRPSDAKYSQLKKVLKDSVFSELESIKLSLKTRDAPEPVARSLNRPANVVRLTTSDLPQLNWASVSPNGYSSHQVNVDDLLDMVSPSGQQQQQPRNGTAPPPPPPSSSWAVTATSSSQPAYQPKYTLSSQAENTHALFYTSRLPGSGGSALPPPPPPSSSGPAGPRYPSLQHLMPSAGTDPSAVQQQMQQMIVSPSYSPALAPQLVEVLSVSGHHHPGAPGSCSDPHPAAPGPPPPEVPPPSASPAPGGPKELVKRAALRDVHVSVALMEEFLRYAAANTARGIESCGILAASLSANDSVFTISTLIIPKQKGTSDTVEMLSEEDVLMVHLEKELYPLGWIHTHPTQTCFLSSVDVHTQCSYQTMLDEAVAIVMAPSDRAKRCGIFRLTTPGGLSQVQKCEQRGFHTHPDTSTGQQLYELCGHVYLNDRVRHEVVDLR